MPKKYPKQEPLHTCRAFSSTGALYAAVCVLGIFSVSAPLQAQQAAVGSSDLQSTVRLVAIGGLRNGSYVAGVDLTMSLGSHTYWKMPGEAGVPPVFTFNGSENVRQADVKFPVPSRITEEGLDAFGYGAEVVFPVAVTPVDPSKPSTLHVDVTYAICNRICLPGHSDAKLTLLPDGAGSSPELVEAALARVPQSKTDVGDLHVSRQASAPQPTWTLTWAGQMPVTDIFSDAPEGFFFSTRKTGPSTWTLTAEESVTAGKSTKVPVLLVLADGTSSIETTRTFDIGQDAK